MSVPTQALASARAGGDTVRVAAAGDLHCSEANRAAVEEAIAAVAADVDAVLLAGDLTTHGEPEQAAVLADACRDLETPVIAVLGNHDLHAGQAAEVVDVLRDADIELLDRSHTVVSTAAGCGIGIVGIKGFVGGFRGLGLPDFGEPSLRGIYAETGEEVAALDEGLKQIALCPFRIALLHYAPTPETLHGEPVEIWAFLGSDRLAAPILQHRPDLVLHGHAHAGTFESAIEGVPVYNVSVPVMGRDFWVFELSSGQGAQSAIH